MVFDANVSLTVVRAVVEACWTSNSTGNSALVGCGVAGMLKGVETPDEASDATISRDVQW